MRVRLVAVAFTALFSPAGLLAQGVAPAVRPVPAAAMNRYFDRLADFGASGSVVVIRRGKVVYRHGFGWADRARRIPMTPSSAVDIASISKHLTAVAILQLEERGLLRRSDSIGTHVDSVPADKRAITIQQLLTHRSGLPAFFVEGNDFTRLTRDEALLAIMGAELEFPPGTDESYSDAGFTLLGIIVEKRTSRTLEEFMLRGQFERAGMRRTHAYGSAALGRMSALSRGYLGQEDRGTPAGYVKSPDYWVVKGAGGIVSTADDLAAWEMALERGVLVGSSSRAAYEGTGEDSIAIAGELVGLPSGKRARVITGAQDFGFAAGIVRYPTERTTAVITINRQPQAMDISYMRNAMIANVDAFLFGTVPAAPASSNAHDLPTTTGTFRLADSSTIRVERDGDFLVLFPDGPLAVELLAYGVDSVGRDNRLASSVRAVSIVERFCRGDASPLRAAMVRQSERVEAFIRTTACPDPNARLRSVGTTPRWWTNPPTAQPATILEIAGATGAKRMRLEWTGDRISALGGGGIEAPATPFSFSDRDGELVGYHFGIRLPVRVVVSPTTLEFRGAGAMGIAQRVP